MAGWQFKAIAKAAIPDTDDLAMFFGTFNMIAGLMSLMLQLLLTGRVLRTLGVGPALFIVPTAMMLGSIGVLDSRYAGRRRHAQGERPGAALFHRQGHRRAALPAGAVRAHIPRQVVHRHGGLPPGRRRRRPDRAAVCGGARLVAGEMSMVGRRARRRRGWSAAFVARRQYVENLRESIHQHRVDHERASMPVMDRDTTQLISSRLKGNTREIAYALNLFEMAHDRKVHPAVRGLLNHAQPEIRQQAIRLLARAGDATVKDEVEQLLKDPSLEVRTEALLYLTAFDDTDPLERIEQLGDFEDFSIRAALVAFLARPGRTQNVDAARLMLAKMVEEPGEEGRRTRLEAARLIAILPDTFERELRTLLDDEDVEVARTAIGAVGALKKRSMIGTLLDRLAEPALNESSVAALAKFGDRIVGTLRDYLVDPEMRPEVRREIPRVLQEIGTTAAQSVLMESMLDRDVVLRYHTIAAHQSPGPGASRTIDGSQAHRNGARRRDHGPLPLLPGAWHAGARWTTRRNPVEHGLRESMEKETERIFRLLKILYPQYDLHSAHVGLQSEDPVVHDNAVEFIDSVLPPEVRSLIIPLFDRDVTVAPAHRHRQSGAGLDARRSRRGHRSDGAERRSVAAFVRGLRDGRDAPDPLCREAGRMGAATTPIRCCARRPWMRGRSCAMPRPQPQASTRSSS